MYSPKISEKLIPEIYRIAKAKGVSMVSYVNDLIYQSIKDIKVQEVKVEEKTETVSYVIMDEKR